MMSDWDDLCDSYGVANDEYATDKILNHVSVDLREVEDQIQWERGFNIYIVEIGARLLDFKTDPELLKPYWTQARCHRYLLDGNVLDSRELQSMYRKSLGVI
jgi:hypothetical protein